MGCPLCETLGMNPETIQKPCHSTSLLQPKKRRGRKVFGGDSTDVQLSAHLLGCQPEAIASTFE